MSRLKQLIKDGWDLSDMSKDMKIDMLLDDIRDLSIAEVLESYGVRPAKITYNKVFALCPFHLDEHIGSFSIDKDLNFCYCFSCQKGGDAIKSMSIIWNKSYIDSALQIAADFGLITNEEYTNLAGTEYTDEYLDKKIKREVVIRDNRNNKPNNETLKMWTDIYEYLRDYFGLSEEDYRYLSETRNLSKERIKRDYFSFNVSDQKEASRIIFNLKKVFPQYVHLLSTVPGFFEVKEKDRFIISMLMTNSLGILLRNVNGQVVAIQQRDKSENPQSRYYYYSWKVPGKNSFIKGGGSVGTPIDVCIPKYGTKEPKVAIVEGRFKAEILAQHGFITLSVQGVNNIRGIEKDILDIEDKYKTQLHNVYIFYDADQIRNSNVFEAGVKLSNYLQEALPRIENTFVIWPPEYGKGIDDLALAGKIECCKMINRCRYVATYKRSYEAAIAITGINLRNIAKISKEERSYFFDVFERLNRKDFNL